MLPLVLKFPIILRTRTQLISRVQSMSAVELQCQVREAAPPNETVQEPCVGTVARVRLSNELTALCRNRAVVPLTIGTEENPAGDCRAQVMPFDHRRVVAGFNHARPQTIAAAIYSAVCCQPAWERTPIDNRVGVFERAAELLAGDHRHRVIAAAVLGQGMTAIQAEYNVCQLIDHLRFGSHFMRDLTRSRCVVDGGESALNRNQYHGLEGFWAAITPSDSFALASQLAIYPALMGNGVVWKPSDHAVLSCYRVLECLRCAGLPPGVISFIPADENIFLDAVCSSEHLAGISFGGTTPILECIHRQVGERVCSYARFPRIVGTGSGKNFHLVHASARLSVAVACTVRAAFEMAGQKSTSCSRVYVAESVADRFIEMITCITQSLVICHPLDYRCFMSALVSKDAFDKAGDLLDCVSSENGRLVQVLCGGRRDGSVGYYVEPTVVVVRDPSHALLRAETRAPVLAVYVYRDADFDGLIHAVSQAPYAITGSVFAQDMCWARWAVGALRDCAATLYVNDRCSEEQPAQQSVGGSRKSGTGAKAGSISYLLQFAVERSLKEARRADERVTYRYMDECPPCCPCKGCPCTCC